MKLQRSMAVELATGHPDEAAASLEQLDPAEAAEFIASLPAEAGSGVLLRVTAHAAAGLLARLEADDAAAIIDRLPAEVAAGYLRLVESSAREQILLEGDPVHVKALRALLRFRERTAGALMDPQVLALPMDVTVSEAIDRVRRSADHARYNLYVVDRDDRLVGVLNLRELMLAKPRQRLEQIMRRDVLRLDAGWDARALMNHPGWQQVHALPVVDEGGTYLGAIRYRTLRRLESEEHEADSPINPTSRALADLFQAALSGVLDTMTLPEAPGRTERSSR